MIDAKFGDHDKIRDIVKDIAIILEEHQPSNLDVMQCFAFLLGQTLSDFPDTETLDEAVAMMGVFTRISAMMHRADDLAGMDITSAAN